MSRQLNCKTFRQSFASLRTRRASSRPRLYWGRWRRTPGGGLRNRLIALGEGDRYAAQQGIQSPAVHGTWVDLVMRHLEVVDGGLRPNPTWMAVDSGIVLPLSMAVLSAVRAYLDTFLPTVAELTPVDDRIADLEDRISRSMMPTRIGCRT